MPFQNTKYLHLHFSVCQSSWEFIFGRLFRARHSSHIKGICTLALFTTTVWLRLFLRRFFAKYSHTFIFIGSNYDSTETLASYFRADEVFTDFKWVIPPRARGIKVSFYRFHPPCFHYSKRGRVHTSQLFFFFFVKTGMGDSVWLNPFYGELIQQALTGLMPKETVRWDVPAPV